MLGKLTLLSHSQFSTDSSHKNVKENLASIHGLHSVMPLVAQQKLAIFAYFDT